MGDPNLTSEAASVLTPLCIKSDLKKSYSGALGCILIKALERPLSVKNVHQTISTWVHFIIIV